MIELARILCARLESKVAPGSWHASRELSDVFLDLGPRFSVYVPYIIHYNEALEALQELIKSSKRFQQFSDESSRAFRSLDFAAILIMPIQRIPRYILLLKALIKATPRSHPDYDQLNKALDLMSTIATDINNQVKKYENHLTVCKIDSLLVPRIKEFVQPDREFVGSGMVIMYDDKKKLRRNKQKVRTVFLFSDVFLLAKHIPASGVYHLKFMIYLNPSVHVEHNPYVKDVGNEHVDCVFRLHSERADQSITLMTRTMDEKISWLIALEQTLFLIKDKLTTNE